jgi:hypothetical protein
MQFVALHDVKSRLSKGPISAVSSDQGQPRSRTLFPSGLEAHLDLRLLIPGRYGVRQITFIENPDSTRMALNVLTLRNPVKGRHYGAWPKEK